MKFFSKFSLMIYSIPLSLLTGCGMADLMLFRGGSGAGGAWSNMLLSAGVGGSVTGAFTSTDFSGNRYVLTQVGNGYLAFCSTFGTQGAGSEALLIKLSSLGAIRWCVRFGGLSGTLAGLVLDNTNGIGYPYGITNGSVGTQLVSQGAQDVYVIRFAQSTGAVGWLSQMGSGGVTSAQIASASVV